MVDLTTRKERKGSRKGILWLFLALILAALVTGILWMVNRNNKVDSPSILGDSRNNPLLADLDRDELPQWEEEIYGTDPKNPDTDGDGTSDGEEVRNRRNPLVKGPDDLVSAGETASGSTAAGVSGNLTQKLFEEFIRQGGVHAIVGRGDSQSASQILNKEIDRLIQDGQLDITQNIAPGPAKINPDTSPTVVLNYLNRVADIFEKHILPLQKDDLDLVIEIFEAGDLSRLAELEPYRAATLRASEEITLLSVPKNLSWFHSRELALLNTTAEELRVLQNAEQDPVAALATLSQRIDTKMAVITFHRQELASWIEKEKIGLGEKDNAWLLVN